MFGQNWLQSIIAILIDNNDLESIVSGETGKELSNFIGATQRRDHNGEPDSCRHFEASSYAVTTGPSALVPGKVQKNWDVGERLAW
jgi:hypothetical protein